MATGKSTYNTKQYSPEMQAILDYLFVFAGRLRMERGPDDRDVKALGKAIHYLMLDGKKKRGET